MLNKIDIVFGVLAWVCGLGSIFANNISLPGDPLDYQLKYYPIAWLVCMLGVLICRKMPWRKLWWVWLSLLPVWYEWIIFIYFAAVMLKRYP
jgi:hypothetical protein